MTQSIKLQLFPGSHLFDMLPAPMSRSERNPLEWLSLASLPRWLGVGLERRVGGFVEDLTWEGAPILGPRRCMVQARQIFSMRTAITLGVANPADARAAMRSGLQLLTERFSLPSGAFRHSIREDGTPLDDTPGLYGQAFALFGLAEGFATLGDQALRDRALQLEAYLRRERAAPGGGFTELDGGREVYRSNPHMHLFEAALAWMEADAHPLWRRLADDLLDLCLNHFIDPATRALAENFARGWTPERAEGRRFYWEPGHHCEWSWLLGRYQSLTGRDLVDVRTSLFELAEQHGRDPARDGVLIDQVWSDFTPKLRSARFWPQCERIKAATQLARAASAREGMKGLFRYFDQAHDGLWFDTWEESGHFEARPVKASSLYHIIGAIAEFQKLSSGE